MDVAPSWNSIHQGIAASRVYEPHITREIGRLPLSGKVFVDGGANIGYFTLLACRLGAKTWAIEPDARNFWFLLRNLDMNGFSAEVFPYAVADRERIMLFTDNDGIGQLSDYKGEIPTAGQAIIRTVTLDHILDRVTVDVMKLDVEGAEWLALAGASRVLQDRPMLFLEFSPPALQAISHISPFDFLEHFVRLGYRIEVITENGTTLFRDPNQVIETALHSQGSFADLVLRPST
jgi:FkbM family methyltransferase